MELAKKTHIKKTSYIITFSPKTMEKVTRFTKAQMSYIANIDDIVNKIKSCEMCPRANDSRLDHCIEFYAIRDVLKQNMSFWQETMNKHLELSQDAGITYKFELDENSIRYPHRTRIAIGQFEEPADEIITDLGACKFINDKNCGTSIHKDEIISFMLSKKAEFKEGKEVTAIYGSP